LLIFYRDRSLRRSTEYWFFPLIVEPYPLFSRKSTFYLSISNLFLPYIILLITFSLFTEPSASPLLYSYMIAFLTAWISLFNPFTNLSIFLIFRLLAFSIHSSSFSTFFGFRYWFKCDSSKTHPWTLQALLYLQYYNIV